MRRKVKLSDLKQPCKHCGAVHTLSGGDHCPKKPKKKPLGLPKRSMLDDLTLDRELDKNLNSWWEED